MTLRERSRNDRICLLNRSDCSPESFALLFPGGCMPPSDPPSAPPCYLPFDRPFYLVAGRVWNCSCAGWIASGNSKPGRPARYLHDTILLLAIGESAHAPD